MTAVYLAGLVLSVGPLITQCYTERRRSASRRADVVRLIVRQR